MLIYLVILALTFLQKVINYIFVFSLQDEKLSVEEILDKYDLFVGSQVTDFGEALTKHDEF